MSPPPRRLIVPVLALAGTAAGLAFGVWVVHLSFGAPLVMVGLGGMTLGLSALALWRMLDPLVNPEPPRVESPKQPARIRELQREKHAVLKAIKEIEMDHQMGKLSETDWRELTQRYRARAMRIISELEAGDDYRTLIEQEIKHRIAAANATGATTAVASASIQTAAQATIPGEEPTS